MALNIRARKGATAIAVPKSTDYYRTESMFTPTSTSLNHLRPRGGYLCWAVEGPGNAPGLFCSCSNSDTLPVMTQAPTSNAAFEICGYATYPSITYAGGSAKLVLNSKDSLPYNPSSSVISTSDFALTSTSVPSIPSVFATSEIPLWGQCNQIPGEVCAGGAQCICKDLWWSQCRLPLGGSWVPYNETWLCSGPDSAYATPSRTIPLYVSVVQSMSISAAPTSSTIFEAISPIEVNNSLSPIGNATSSSSPIPPPPPLSSSSSTTRSSHLSQSRSSFPVPTPPSITMSAAYAGFDRSSKTTPRPSKTTTFLQRPTLSLRPAILSLPSINSSFGSTTGVSLSMSSQTIQSTTFIAAHQPYTSNRARFSSSSFLSSPTYMHSLSSLSSITDRLLHVTPSPSLSSTTLSRLDYNRSNTSNSLQKIFVSATASITSRQRMSMISSTITINGPIGSSESAPLPNLACPSQPSSAENRETSQSSDLLAPQACELVPPRSPGGLFQPASSLSTASSSLPTNSNPSKTGIYLDSSAPKDQQSACQNFAAHQYQLCWEVLNITGYIRDWVSFNQARCNGEDMGFADCFVYVEVGGGQNCTAFTGRSQCPSPDPKTFAAQFNGAQAYYVAFNIWNIQNWFFTYYLAVQGANGLASDNVNTIARTLNLPLPQSFRVMDLLAALAFAFGLLSPSGYAAVLPKLGEKVGAQAPGEYLLRAVQNTPTLSRNLVTAGDLSKTDVQVAQLGSDLARITSQLENNIQSSVIMVLSNFSLFFDFVQDGFFSTQIEDLNTLAANVTLSLNTYLVSQALQDDKVIITRAVNTDVNELQLNGSAVNLDTGCGNGYDEWGMCGSWWYDETSNTSYGLESLKNMMNNYTDPLESLFNQGITTPELLFINSQVCADVAGSTQGSAPGTSLSTSIGVWNTECISNLKICSWDLVNLGVTNEFTDCDHESSFAMNGCGAGEDTVQVNVPASYIGPYMTSPLFQGQVCNHWWKGMGSPG